MTRQPMTSAPLPYRLILGSASRKSCVQANRGAPLDRFQGIVDAHVTGDRSEGVGCNAGTTRAVVAWRERFHEHEGRRLVDPEPVKGLGIDQPLDLLLPDSCCTRAAV
jgi:hypothetical protein